MKEVTQNFNNLDNILLFQFFLDFLIKFEVIVFKFAKYKNYNFEFRIILT